MPVPSAPSWFRHPAIVTGATVLAAIGLLWARRGSTLATPSVWVEEGSLILPGMAERGVGVLLDPVAGYFITVTKLLDLAAFGISATWFPLVSTALGWLFTIAVVVAITLSPTWLRYRPLAALAVLLVPSDPEVIGTTLYTLWWAGLLLLLVALWKDDERPVLRIVLAVVGGLSSPVVFLVAPILIVRAALRRRHGWVIAGVTTALAIVQGVSIVLTGKTGVEGSSTFTFRGIRDLLDRLFGLFPGNYLVGAWTDSTTILLVVGVALALVVLAGFVLQGRSDRVAGVVILALLAGSIVLSTYRTLGIPIDPVTAGPRYFFYPFVLISWLLLLAAATWKPRWTRVVPAALLIVATANAGAGGWSRGAEDLGWHAHLESCPHFDRYAIPIQFAGEATHTWHADLTGEQCAAWLARDPLRDPLTDAGYPATMVPTTMGELAIVGPAAIGSDLEAAPDDDLPAGLVVLSSQGLTGARTVEFELERGDRLMLRTSDRTSDLTISITPSGAGFRGDLRPFTAWSWLAFSNRELPDRFVVTIEDRGSDPEQWFEVVASAESPPRGEG